MKSFSSSTVFSFLSLVFISYLSFSDMEVEGLGDDQFILDFVRRVHEREANALPHEEPNFQRPDSKNAISSQNKNVYNNVNHMKNPSSNDQKKDRHQRHLAEASCGNVANIEVISGQGEYTLYVDGERIGSRAGSMKANFETIIESHGPTVLAFEATRDNLMNFKDNGGIAIQTSLCDKTYGTHSENWVCTYEKPWTDAWKKWEYNTTTWFPARLVHNEGKYKVSENLSKEHNNYAIWSTDCGSGDIPEKAYCRTLIDHKCPNACFLANPAPQAVGRCWYNCDVNTVNYDVCTRFENRLNTMCSECEPEEIETARQNCVNYGCSAKQCNMEEDPELIPDLSCLNSCQKALGTTARSTCDTQNFYFTQGCDSCGPRALAYAKSLCLTEHKCSEEECAIGNESIDTNTNYAPSPVPTDTNDNNNNNNDSNDSSDPMDLLPEDTPDVSCFLMCLRGTNQYEDNCDKTNYIFESGCGSRCPQSTLDWAADECLKYVSPTGQTCSEAQCGL